MNYRYIYLMVSFCLCIRFVSAKEFEILYITSPTIEINGKNMKVGDTFSDGYPIKWSSPRQAVKVRDLSTQKQSLIVAEKYKELKSRNLASYLIDSKILSTRRGEALNTLQLGMLLDDAFYLLDPITFETGLPTDEHRFFFASYDYDGETINKKLKCENGVLTFDYDLFTIDGKSVKPFDVTLTVWYMDYESGTRTLISDKMKILQLDEIQQYSN